MFLYSHRFSLVVAFWFDNLMLAVIMASAMVVNLLAAAVAGTLIPIILKALNADPAVAGSVVLTTVTDVVGFVSFLGLSSVLLV